MPTPAPTTRAEPTSTSGSFWAIFSCGRNPIKHSSFHADHRSIPARNMGEWLHSVAARSAVVVPLIFGRSRLCKRYMWQLNHSLQANSCPLQRSRTRPENENGHPKVAWYRSRHRQLLAQRPDHRLDTLFHRRCVKWLDDVIVHAERNRLLDLFLVGTASRHDEWHGLRARVLADHLEQGQSINVFHVPVGNDQVDIGFLQLAQGIAAALGLNDVLEAKLGKDVLADTAHGLLIIDDENTDSAGFRHGRIHLPGARELTVLVFDETLGKKRYKSLNHRTAIVQAGFMLPI